MYTMYTTCTYSLLTTPQSSTDLVLTFGPYLYMNYAIGPYATQDRYGGPRDIYFLAEFFLIEECASRRKRGNVV
jgi:hypothetical protein